MATIWPFFPIKICFLGKLWNLKMMIIPCNLWSGLTCLWFLPVGVLQYKPEIYCIPYQQYLAEGGYVASRLAAGNWSFRIRVTSLAGNGSWTDYQYFYITSSGMFSHLFSHLLAVQCTVLCGHPDTLQYWSCLSICLKRKVQSTGRTCF